VHMDRACQIGAPHPLALPAPVQARTRAVMSWTTRNAHSMPAGSQPRTSNPKEWIS
jgi:hypothetical protein